jgi:hypothetical protein
MERKYDEVSSSSSDKQGTYYQFLIERKVPKGTLRHIASLINVTYEFTPNNHDCKRRKFEDGDDKIYDFKENKKDSENLKSNMTINDLNDELNVLQNLELKRMEDKLLKVNSFKDSKL